MLCEVEEATAAQAEAVIDRSRAKTRERVQRWRETHHSNVTERYETSPSVTKRLVREPARVEDKPLLTEIEPLKEGKREARATRLSPEWTLPVEWRADAREAGIPEARIDAVALDLRDWSLSSPNGAKRDWRATWRRWCRRVADEEAKAGPKPVAPSQAEVFAIIARNPNNAIEPGPSEDRGSFRQAIPHLSAVRTG
jgi:hypothetical protein